MRPLFAIAPLALLLTLAGSPRERTGLSDAVGTPSAARGDWVRQASSPEPQPEPPLSRLPRTGRPTSTDTDPTVLRTSLRPGRGLSAEAAYPVAYPVAYPAAYPQRLPR
ncbi:MAG: hypothetical protein IIA02_04015 [Proteobacteria bacterium]|uniref:hypothetical protein n=1 Tax=Aquabacterium sp. TaxID=1872578 RepID=UPI0035C7568A|nr:hypothetical protein [Pseudomonadota bacterium]